MKEAERSLPTISTAPGEKTTMRSLLSRDSTDYFVNFNLYACSVVLLGRLRTTQTTPLTRQRKAGDLSCPEMQRDMHIKISDREASLLINRIYYPMNVLRTIAENFEYYKCTAI